MRYSISYRGYGNATAVGNMQMTRRGLTIALAVLGLVGIQFAAAAAPNGTADEAKVLVEKAVKLIGAEGNKAYAAFDNPAGPFVDRDLYIFVIDLKGTVVSHGANKALIGKSLFNLKDADGKAFIQEMIGVANDKGEGWIDYHWPNPVSKKVEGKSSFIKKIGDVFVGVGVYKG